MGRGSPSPICGFARPTNLENAPRLKLLLVANRNTRNSTRDYMEDHTSRYRGAILSAELHQRGISWIGSWFSLMANDNPADRPQLRRQT